MTVISIDSAGNISPPSVPIPLSIIFDTTPPDKPVLTTSTLLTNDSTPTVSVNAEPDSFLTIYVQRTDGNPIQTSDEDGNPISLTEVSHELQIDSTGDFNVTFEENPDYPTQDGEYEVTATSTDAAGNVSEISDPLLITIDTTAPAKPSITTTTALTNDSTPTIEGTAESGSTVELFNGSESLGTVTADNDGNFSITSPELADADYTLTVTATDEAGNTSVASAGLPITIDTTAPAAPILDSDYFISYDQNSFNLTGSAEAGSALSLFIDGTKIEITETADELTGEFSLEVPSQADCIYSLVVKSTDPAGNISDQSSEFSLTKASDINAVSTDTDDIQIKSDSNGYVYLWDGTNDQILTQVFDYNQPAVLSESSEYTIGTVTSNFSKLPVASTLTNDGYKLAVKNEFS